MKRKEVTIYGDFKLKEKPPSVSTVFINILHRFIPVGSVTASERIVARPINLYNAEIFFI